MNLNATHLSKEMITDSDFRRMMVGAYHTFMREHEKINNLNVYPVPDGDTGTNMLLTLAAVEKAVSSAQVTGIGALAKRAADSAIMGARGNSGVILSQIFRGIARGLTGKTEATSSELGKAFQYGVLYAYRAVSRPVEGTILTVAKGIAKGARRAVREDHSFAVILEEAIAAGKKELARTPELLPVLKSAGVVDAGGQGLIAFLTGCREGLLGISSGPEADFDRTLSVPAIEEAEKVDISHPYCTEFIVKHCTQPLAAAKKLLQTMGESLVLAEGEQLLKVHIHTARPGSVLESAITWGTLHDIKIDNMADQHHHRIITSMAAAAKPRTPLGVISVVSGDGLSDMMYKLGADIVINGGQSMNPPVEDFIAAIHAGTAERYIILPNNKNIQLAAVQTKKLMDDKVEVVATTNIPQGFSALMAFDPQRDIAANVQVMTERIGTVKAGSLTKAVRDSKVDGRLVPSGNFIGLVGSQITIDGVDLESVLISLAGQLAGEESELISLYYGSDISQAEAEGLAEKLRDSYPQLEVELYAGGQPYYHFFISVE